MKKPNWITVLALRSSIVLSIVLLSAKVAYTASTDTSLSYLIALSPSPVSSLTPTPTPTQGLTDDVINANEKFNFELLHDAAKRNYDRYMNVVWGSFGFLLIAIGWIMTSERAWIFLHEHKGIRVAGIVSIILIFVFNIYTLRQAEQTSAQLLQFMGQDPYVSSSIKQDYYYRQYKVPPFYLGVLVNSPLFIYLGYMVYACGLKEPPRGEGKVKKTSPESEL